jgi:hypothetical protein
MQTKTPPSHHTATHITATTPTTDLPDNRVSKVRARTSHKPIPSCNAGRHWGLGARYAFHAMRLCVGVRGVSRFVGIEQNSNEKGVVDVYMG